MDFKQTITTAAKNKIGKVLLQPINDLVDDSLSDITTTIGSFVVRSIRGKFQRSITFTIGMNYSDKWMEEALYGILYTYNNIRASSKLELKNKQGFSDGTGMYYQLDDGTHNLKYRDYNILLAIQTNSPASMTGRISQQKIYTIITYDLSPEFVKYFEADMIAHRNSLLKIRSDSKVVNVYQDLHEGDGYTYWERTGTISKRKIGTIYLPKDVKQKIVDTVNEFFGNKEYYQTHGIAHNLKILLYGPPGPQPVSIEIPTPDGIRRFGDIRPGDYVFGFNGQPTKVEDVRVYTDLDVYEIEFDDGRKVKCGADHKWPTIDEEGQFVEKTVGQMINEGIKPGELGYNHRIPVGDEVLFPTKEVPIDPWVVGVLIGNRGKRYKHRISFTEVGEKTIVALCKKCGLNWKTRERYEGCSGNFGYSERILIDKNSGIDIDPNEFLKYIPELLCSSKYDCEDVIPKAYLFNSRENRYSLLQGIMDAGGYVKNWLRSGSVEFTTENKTLMKQFVFLVRSLGFVVSIDENLESDNYKGTATIYCGDRQRHLFFRNSMNAIKSVTSKFMPGGSIIQTPSSNFIINITKLGYKEDMHCLHVEDWRHLYQTTDFVVTCNTGKDSIAKMIASEWNRNMYYITGGKSGNFIPNAIVDNDSDINHPLFLVSDIDKYPFLINEPEVDMVKDGSTKDEQLKYKQLFGNMINALDGVLSGEGRIIVMTTNHIEKFSDVILRPGRIDLKLEIGYVTPEVLRKYVLDFYNVVLPADIKLKNNKLTVADMQFDVVFLKLSAEEFIKKHVK